MFKNLTLDSVRGSQRQNEMIELALTFGYPAVEVDMRDMVSREQAMGRQFACQFVNCASVNVGAFELATQLSGSDEDFASELQKLDGIIELAEAIDAQYCYLRLESFSSELPYHENFERHRLRVTQVADKLAEKSIRLGIGFQPIGGQTEGESLQFISNSEDLAMFVKTLGKPNVGIQLETWQWIVGGGTLESIKTATVDNIFEVRFADAPEEFDRSSITLEQQFLPCHHESSISTQLVDWLIDGNFQGPISISGNCTELRNLDREEAVRKASQTMDKLAAGELMFAAESAPPEAEQAEEAAIKS